MLGRVGFGNVGFIIFYHILQPRFIVPFSHDDTDLVAQIKHGLIASEAHLPLQLQGDEALHGKKYWQSSVFS